MNLLGYASLIVPAYFYKRYLDSKNYKGKLFQNKYFLTFLKLCHTINSEIVSFVLWIELFRLEMQKIILKVFNLN